MAFDALTRATLAPAADLPAGADHAPVSNPDPAWVARNPDRMLALLFVAPRDCAAIDALYAADR